MKKNLLICALICASPALFLTIVWLVTFGSFNLIEALHHGATQLASGFMIAFAVVAMIVFISNDESNEVGIRL